VKGGLGISSVSVGEVDIPPKDDYASLRTDPGAWSGRTGLAVTAGATLWWLRANWVGVEGGSCRRMGTKEKF
jgi:hypothetical protein